MPKNPTGVKLTNLYYYMRLKLNFVLIPSLFWTLACNRNLTTNSNKTSTPHGADKNLSLHVVGVNEEFSNEKKSLLSQDQKDQIKYFIQNIGKGIIDCLGDMPTLKNPENMNLNYVIDHFFHIKENLASIGDEYGIEMLKQIYSPADITNTLQCNKILKNKFPHSLTSQYKTNLELQLGTLSLQLKVAFMEYQKKENPLYLDRKTFAEQEKLYPIHSNTVSFSQAIFDSMRVEGVDDAVIDYFKENLSDTTLLDIYRAVTNDQSSEEKIRQSKIPFNQFVGQWKSASIESLIKGWLPGKDVLAKIETQEKQRIQELNFIVDSAADRLQEVYDYIDHLNKAPWANFLNQAVVKLDEVSKPFLEKRETLADCYQQTTENVLSQLWKKTAETLAARMGMMFLILVGREQEPERVNAKLVEQAIRKEQKKGGNEN